MSAQARPGVTLKLATSLDGRIATAAGESKWITGEEARVEAHRLRAAHDVVLIGSQTLIDDDPLLTVRLDGYSGPQPIRAVADGRLRSPPRARLLQSASADAPVMLITDEDGPAAAEPAASAFPSEVRVALVARGADGRLDPAAIVQAAGLCSEATGRRACAVARIMIEGGGALAASFVRAGLVDRIEWFRAPLIIGAEGRPAIGEAGLTELARAPRFERVDARALGADLWERYERAPGPA